mmetsp:Transcript_7431/g.14056  ORF Transcript_7431/g.14056 Transcript_7431/m.14056 type:complete len:115 (-) Transcript_7431:255-599(-)
MKNKVTGLPTYPPDNRTDWNNATGQELKKLHKWLDANSLSVTGWETNKCMAYWPEVTGLDEDATYQRFLTTINMTTTTTMMNNFLEYFEDHQRYYHFDSVVLGLHLLELTFCSS